MLRSGSQVGASLAIEEGLIGPARAESRLGWAMPGVTRFGWCGATQVADEIGALDLAANRKVFLRSGSI